MTNKEELLQIITKLENLEEEKAAIAQNMTDTLVEAKMKG
ncbi:GapR family DNA-binding domain-containing protein [Candidatus Bandiella numerosa]|nr:GapR family DNA-binding domain-containing protein [Candidatus Bandiella numerosa]